MSELRELRWSEQHDAIVRIDENGDPVPVPIHEVESESVVTEDLNNAKFVSEHDSIQAAIDAAGESGTVVFDGPGTISVSSDLSFYDDQAIHLWADIERSDNAEHIFELNGRSGVSIVPNGRWLDGTSTANGAGLGILFDQNTSNCSVDGLVRIRRMRWQGIRDYGTNNHVEAVYATNIGYKGNNSALGDAYQASGSNGGEQASVGLVIGDDCHRHTVTITSEGAAVGNIISRDPGGAHLSLEGDSFELTDVTVESVHGTGARAATGYSSPDQDYVGYPEIAFNGGASDNHIGSIVTEDPHGGNADSAAVGYRNGADDNHIGFVKSVNAAGDAISFGEQNNARGNSIDHVVIDGAGRYGVLTSNETTGCAIGGGRITNCAQNGVDARSPVEIESVRIANNCQESGQAGILVRSLLSESVVEGCEIYDDQDTPTQQYAVRSSNNGVGIRLERNDMSGSPTAFDISWSNDRYVINGTAVSFGSPDGSDYDISDVGLQIIDTSASPPDQYVIDETGSISGPL